MADKIKTVIFTVVVTALFAMLVSGVNATLADRIMTNQTIARQRVVVGLFGLVEGEEILTDKQVAEIFANSIEPVVFKNQRKLEVYKTAASAERRYVVAFSGQGFWDTIKGYVAISPDKMKLNGLEFTAHGETPGLGGRISEPDFKSRLKDRDISTKRSDGLRLKFVSEGSASKDDEVDGITGATGTSSAIEKIINKTIENFLKIEQGGAEN